jgi:hypothetical protein
VLPARLDEPFHFMDRLRTVLMLLLALSTLSAASALAQATASVGGYVTDSASRETLLLANVRLVGTQLGTATNNSGYYTLAGISPGDHTLHFSYVGYRSQEIQISLTPGEQRRLDVMLVPEDIQFEEITVTADAELEEEVRQVGVLQLRTDIIRRLPAVLQPDVFRSLQLLPGVKAASDYSSGLYIRGGGPDQTLILLDRTTVYNPSHFFGFFSTFNPDAIKDVRLYKGGYPAAYGGRLGSVVDIYNRDGNRNEYEAGLTIGLLSSSAIVEGPYGRGSWMLAARRSTLEPLLYLLREADVEGIPDAFHFVDVNAKINFDAGENDRLSLAFYTGSDELEIGFLEDARADLVYGNRTISLNWTHLFSQQLFSNFTATGSHYASNPALELSGTRFSQENQVADVSLKGDLQYIPNGKHTLEAGVWSGIFTFRLRNVFDGDETLRARMRSVYSSVYLQETFAPTPLWSIRSGIRADYFQEGNFLRLSPRLSLEYRPLDSVRLQMAYGRYYQFLTLITSELFSGFDTWLTTGEDVPPAYGDQFVAALKTTVARGINVDAEIYYRTMNDLFELDPFVPDPAGLDYVDLFRFGDGFAYGYELLTEKSIGKLNGFAAYTLSRTRRRFPNVKNFEYYSPKYDRTHDLHIVANFDFSRTWRASMVWSYATGQAYTRPLAQYKLIDDPFGADIRDVLVTEYNNARLPPYHRLDAGISLRGTLFKKAAYELQLQVINAYARRNIWFYFYEFRTGNSIRRTDVPQIPVPLPNISFTVRL